MQTFGWVGMVLTHEHSSTKPHTTVYHAYNDHSYTSLARIECTDTPRQSTVRHLLHAQWLKRIAGGAHQR
ncbi:hypothetical protein PY546_13085 [Providencia stuartii]|nr:hypothetical protein [Providencia stuartii]